MQDAPSHTHLVTYTLSRPHSRPPCRSHTAPHLQRGAVVAAAVELPAHGQQAGADDGQRVGRPHQVAQQQPLAAARGVVGQAVPLRRQQLERAVVQVAAWERGGSGSGGGGRDGA